MPRYKAGAFSGLKVQAVLLNGEAISQVIECDTDEGWLERAVLDESGRPKVRDEEILRERLKGRVEVIEKGDQRYVG